MDSKDKMLADLKKNISDLKNIIPQKDKQISTLKATLDKFNSEIDSVNAVRASLYKERELNIQLSYQIATLKTQISSLQDENSSLKEMNLKLQKPIG
jgi:predicted RNase H-like nuclease (RuvC/YqgF family)